MPHIPQIMPDNGDIYSSRTMLNTSENSINNEVGCEIIQHKHESFLQRLEKSENDNECGVSFNYNNQPLSNTSQFNRVDLIENKGIDGAVLTKKEDNNFEAANELSPILKERHMISNEIFLKEDYEIFPNDNLFDAEKESTKRKRPNDESFDISMKSTDSFAPSTFGTSKKPKLIRTGSITKNLRRSMSFAAMKTPINNIFRLGRNTNDTNCSFNSINSNESPFNDSFKAVKSKMRQIKNKVCKLNKIGIGSSNTTKTKIKIVSEELLRLTKVTKMNSSKSLLASVRTPEKNKNDSCIMEFKTPIAPRQSTSISKSFSSNQTFQKSFNLNQNKSQISSKDSPPSKIANSSHKKSNQSIIQPSVELTPFCMLNVFPVAELSPVFKKKNLKNAAKNVCKFMFHLVYA